MSQILEKLFAKSRLPEATAAFAGFIAGEGAFLFGAPTPESPNDRSLHQTEVLLTGTATALASAGLVALIRSRRNNSP
ncbi:TPA: hypothetical protein DIS56_03360 [Candidatus Saccharibacteria bacterium]|nr:MAG: hypothetical protein UX30_C0005G0050 [Candidatus Saccharibacteria bacterium GW2011_GWA2_46_10]OGL34328.1 MAG: hypothetical protein A3F05_02900 [Candidatus Saccharibacteria bacterium RIFCSPHIGHO2_12_FULL_47_17]HCM52140.1 hypothetical protein [Candidatus Saccharibacteria bacterium]